MFTAASITLIAAVFVASAVEAVEAFTIVLAMGLTRGWKAAISGAVAAVLALAAGTAVVGVTLIHYVSQSLLQFVIGALLLVFGLPRLRSHRVPPGGGPVAGVNAPADRTGRRMKGPIRKREGYLLTPCSAGCSSPSSRKPTW